MFPKAVHLFTRERETARVVSFKRDIIREIPFKSLEISMPMNRNAERGRERERERERGRER
jgi:hypothetical protein